MKLLAKYVLSGNDKVQRSGRPADRNPLLGYKLAPERDSPPIGSMLAADEPAGHIGYDALTRSYECSGRIPEAPSDCPPRVPDALAVGMR